jgi:hypothetical protein
MAKPKAKTLKQMYGKKTEQAKTAMSEYTKRTSVISCTPLPNWSINPVDQIGEGGRGTKRGDNSTHASGAAEAAGDQSG